MFYNCIYCVFTWWGRIWLMRKLTTYYWEDNQREIQEISCHGDMTELSIPVWSLQDHLTKNTIFKFQEMRSELNEWIKLIHHPSIHTHTCSDNCGQTQYWRNRLLNGLSLEICWETNSQEVNWKWQNDIVIITVFVSITTKRYCKLGQFCNLTVDIKNR